VQGLKKKELVCIEYCQKETQRIRTVHHKKRKRKKKKKRYIHLCGWYFKSREEETKTSNK
jgi:hypothetical protein